MSWLGESRCFLGPITVAACAGPGALDGGTHILFAVAPTGADDTSEYVFDT